jgi:hypothetical protein
MRNNLAVWICAILALACPACRKSATFSSKDGSVTVEQKGGDTSSMTFTGKDGKTMTMNVGGGSKLPDNYPKDFPVYPDAKVMVAQSVSEKNAINLVLESGDAADKIADFYKKSLESNGWKIENTMASGELNMYTAVKEKRQAIVQIVNGGDKRSINQVLSDK